MSMIYTINFVTNKITIMTFVDKAIASCFLDIHIVSPRMYPNDTQNQPFSRCKRLYVFYDVRKVTHTIISILDHPGGRRVRAAIACGTICVMCCVMRNSERLWPLRAKTVKIIDAHSCAHPTHSRQLLRGGRGLIFTPSGASQPFSRSVSEHKRTHARTHARNANTHATYKFITIK